MRRNKDFLRNIKKLTALVLAAAAIVTAYNIPIDKTRTITGFMQDPKKNYNAKNQVKVGTVKITAFKNRLTTEAELDKFRKNMGKKDFRETKLGDIEDEAFFYAEEYLPRDDIHIQMYYLKHVKTYKKDKMQFHAAHAIPLPKWLIPAGIRCQKLLDMKSGSNRATMATGRTGRIEERPQIVSRYMDLMEQEN